MLKPSKSASLLPLFVVCSRDLTVKSWWVPFVFIGNSALCLEFVNFDTDPCSMPVWAFGQPVAPVPRFLDTGNRLVHSCRDPGRANLGAGEVVGGRVGCGGDSQGVTAR